MKNYIQVLTTADRFSVDFPPDIGKNNNIKLSLKKTTKNGNKGVEMKATLLAVTFLIDYLHFEADPGDSDEEEE